MWMASMGILVLTELLLSKTHENAMWHSCRHQMKVCLIWVNARWRNYNIELISIFQTRRNAERGIYTKWQNKQLHVQILKRRHAFKTGKLKKIGKWRERKCVWWGVTEVGRCFSSARRQQGRGRLRGDWGMWGTGWPSWEPRPCTPGSRRSRWGRHVCVRVWERSLNSSDLYYDYCWLHFYLLFLTLVTYSFIYSLLFSTCIHLLFSSIAKDRHWEA